MHTKILLYLAFAFTVFTYADTCYAQHVLQYSAEILSADSTRPIPFATVFDRKTGQGTFTNQQGFFSVVALPGDSVEISSVGFHRLIIVIPFEVTQDKLSETLYMYPINYDLSPVVILPFTREQFRYAFIHHDIPHDDLARAYANLNPAVMKRLGKVMPNDAREQADMVLHQYASNYYYMGQRPPMNILNPLAWYEFFKTLNNGGFKNDNSSGDTNGQ